MVRLSQLFLVFFFLLFNISISHAIVPGAINFNGQLLDNSGTPITTSVTLTFTVWDAESGGNQIVYNVSDNWSDTDTITPDNNGFYNTDIGDDPDNPIPPDLFAGPDIWLDIEVDGTSLTPRTRFLTVPYAFSSAISGFSYTAGNALSAQTALTAQSLAGGFLGSPGDSVQLAGNVALTVADDGKVVFQIDGEDYRLESKQWYWDHPDDLSDFINPDGAEVGSIQVAMSNNGDAIIVWQQSNGSTLQVYKSEYRNGFWTHPTSLNDTISFNGFRARSPHVAMNNSGETVIVWSQHDGSVGRIFKSEYRNGSWSHPSSFNDHINIINSTVFNPQVAIDDNGRTIIVWSQIYDSWRGIFMSEYRQGILNYVWDHPSSLTDYISLEFNKDAFSPHVEISNNGEAIIAWSKQADTLHNFDQVFISEYLHGPISSEWFHPSSHSEFIGFGGGHATDLELAMNDNGDTIIAWAEFGDDLLAYKSERTNGVWVHPLGDSDSISAGEGEADAVPQIALNNDGNVLTVLTQEIYDFSTSLKEDALIKFTYPLPDDNNYNISKEMAFNPRGTETSGNGDLIPPSITMNENGDAVIVWQQFDGTSSEAKLNIFKSELRNSSWSHPVALNDGISFNIFSASDPKVAMDDTDRTIIVWVQPDGSNRRIYMSEYKYGFP